MMRVFRTIYGNIHQISEAQEEAGLCFLTDPTATELLEISEKYNIESDDLCTPSIQRKNVPIAREDNCHMILVDIPMIEELMRKNVWNHSLGYRCDGKYDIYCLSEDTLGA